MTTIRYGGEGDPSQRRASTCERRWIWSATLVICLVIGAWCTGEAEAANRARPVRIGILTASWGPTPQVVGLREGLLALGYRENEQFVMGVRFMQGDITALPTAALDLVQLGVDLLVADSDESAKAAQQATSTLPIVFVSVADPVGLGLIQSFARPGGNITGVTDLDLTLSAKRLEIFSELIPSLNRVLFPYDSTDAYTAAAANAYRDAARRLGIELVEAVVHSEAEAQTLLGQHPGPDVDGVLGTRCCSLNIAGRILKATSAWRLPAIFSTAFFVERGALASYGADTRETGRQAARLVDKILKGAKPAELPVEVNPKIEFVINLKTAKILGLTIPPEVLYRADRIVR
jgi:putative ABC transport system substrate-binding protein